MADREHLAILQDALDKNDISIWNGWRNENGYEIVDLSLANLKRVDLSLANLSRANLRKADLRETDLNLANLSLANLSLANLSLAILRGSDSRGADLSGADLSKADSIGADLSGVDLRGADLRGANLRETNLSGAYLSRAKLREAKLREAKLSEANLSRAKLMEADLRGANLSGVNLWEADLTELRVNGTLFVNVDLSVALNLDTIRVEGPCSIGIDTLYKSQALLSEPWFDRFLENCGVPETMRVFASSLVVKPIDYYSCFISYSSGDEVFCQELQSRLKRQGLRVWFAPEEMKGGRKIHEQLYEAIHYHDKLILVLSEASLQSNWVELEIKRARKREVSEGRQVLFPIMLTTFKNLQSWELITSDGEDLAEEIRQYFIPDFTNWKDHDAFTQSVDRLVNDLQKEDNK